MTTLTRPTPVRPLPDGSVVCTVRCRGRMRRIALVPGGALIICDHEPAELVLDRLGGADPCRCKAVMAAWRRGDRAALPDALRELRPSHAGAYELRLQVRLYGPLPDIMLARIERTTRPYSLRERAEQRVQHLAGVALDRATYRQAGTAYRNDRAGHTASVAISDRPSITGSSETVWPSRYDARVSWPGTASEITARVRLDWLRTVDRAGLAVVDGQFICEVVSASAEMTIVRAGRQGRGYSVGTALAEVIRDDAGAPVRLRWLTANQAAKWEGA